MPGNFHPVPEYVLERWPAPNYVDPVRRTWMPAFAMVFPAVSTVLIAGRFWLRATREAGSFGLDDLFIGIGWAVSVGLSALAIIDAQWYDLDRHTWDVKPTHYVGAALVGWCAQVLFLISTCATKTSILLFYRRMVAGTYSRTWLWIIYIALGFLGGYFVAVLFAYCFLCTPLHAYWESYDFDYDEEFTCLNGNILSPFVGAISVFTDVYAVVIPCVMLQRFNLDIPGRQKIGLNVIFALGLVVAGFACARTYYLWEINNNYDTSWVGFNLYVWSLLECHFAIIFACAPSLRAFVRRYLGDSISRTFGSSNPSRHEPFGKEQPAEVTWRDSETMRPIGVPMEVHTQKKPTSRVETRPSQDSLFGRKDDYNVDSSRPSRSDINRPVRTPEEFEAYAMRELKRHAYTGSRTMHESTGYGRSDLGRRYDADNAV